MLDLWHNQGMILLSYNYDGYNRRMIRDLVNLVTFYPANMLDKLNVVALLDHENAGIALNSAIGFGMLKGADYMLQIAKSGRFFLDNFYNFYHETGHHFEQLKKVSNIGDFENLYNLSSAANGDFISNFHPNNDEDFAETVRAYVMDSEAFLARAQQQATAGFPILLQKFQFLAKNLFRTPSGGRYSFHVYQDLNTGEMVFDRKEIQ